MVVGEKRKIVLWCGDCGVQTVAHEFFAHEFFFLACIRLFIANGSTII